VETNNEKEDEKVINITRESSREEDRLTRIERRKSQRGEGATNWK
jgi:hypothetical protein